MDYSGKVINLLTSCDDNLSIYILPQIASIAENTVGNPVNYYLFHTRITPEHIKTLREYCETFPNITFHEVKITETAEYEAIVAEVTDTPLYHPYETYFYFCAHEYLPSDVDRIMYIDAGDVIVDGDFRPYYFTDFDGMNIIAPSPRTVINDNGKGRLPNITDMANIELLKQMAQGLFNASNMILNLDNFRKQHVNMSMYLDITKDIKSLLSIGGAWSNTAIKADEGIIGIAHIGHIKYFPDNMSCQFWYMPYDFLLWYCDHIDEPDYTPVILHYCGTDIKPYYARFKPGVLEKYDFRYDPKGVMAPWHMRESHNRYFERYWYYAEKTPIYDELNTKAVARGEALERFLFPLTKRYNDKILQIAELLK
jgi:lipopolysaccharide biosynthesis glycosyltransferase